MENEAKSESEKFIEHIERQQTVYSVNDELALYRNTGDARFFWRAFLLIRQAGQPIPDDFLNKISQWGGKLLAAQTPTEIAMALELSGNDKRHLGPKQSAAYRRRWELASEVHSVRDLYRLRLSKAIEIVARNRGLSVAKVKHDYHAVSTAPLKQTKPEKGGTLDEAMRAWR